MRRSRVATGAAPKVSNAKPPLVPQDVVGGLRKLDLEAINLDVQLLPASVALDGFRDVQREFAAIVGRIMRGTQSGIDIVLAMKLCHMYRIAPPWPLVARMGMASRDWLGGEERSIDEALGLPRKRGNLKSIQRHALFGGMVKLAVAAEIKQRKASGVGSARRCRDVFEAVSERLRNSKAEFPLNSRHVEELSKEIAPPKRGAKRRPP